MSADHPVVAASSAVQVQPRTLEQDSAEANPFLAPYLLAPALKWLDDDHDIHMLEAHDPGGLVIGRMPVTINVRHGRFPIRHAANWMHRHCFFGAPLLRRGHEEQAWSLLLATLDATSWSGPMLHLRGVDPDGPVIAALHAVCAREGRRCEEIARYERAKLDSALSADDYWTANVRAKKRKELRRLQYRLAELGEISRRALADGAQLRSWIDAFLALEASGWKGERGTALASQQDDSAFMREACTAAWEAGALDMLRIDCADRPIAMLVNFVTPGGGFSFKIAIDPDFARYSPGILIEQDNLARVLDARVAPWMDSCAAPDHPMIDSLWGERRSIAQYRIALRKPGLVGAIGHAALPLMSFVEHSYAKLKSGAK